MWGHSFAVNLLSLLKPSLASNPRILLLGAGDPRHILAASVEPIPVNWFVHENSSLTLGRLLLFLCAANDGALGGARERAELFLSLYANVLVRDRDLQYVRKVAAILVDLLTESGTDVGNFRQLFDFGCLKQRERDALQATLERWRTCNSQSTAFLDRLVNFFKSRFDFRENLLDWQYQTVARLHCPVLHWAEYRRFGLSGVAYEPRLAACLVDNPTVMAPKSRQAMNENAYPGDIGNCALSNFARRSYNANDQERLFRRVNGVAKSTAAQVAEYNVTALLAAADKQTFSLAAEKPEEREFPFLSPMAVLGKVEEISDIAVSENSTALLSNFRSAKIHLLTGDPAAISKRGMFDIVFIGCVASLGFLQKPEIAESVVGNFCVIESLDNSVFYDKHTKSRWRERIDETAKSLGWTAVKAFEEDPELLVYQLTATA